MVTQVDWVAQANAALAVMSAADTATHQFRLNSINELAQLAAVKLLIEGAMDATQWAALQTEIENLKAVAETAVSVLAQAAAVKASAVPAAEVATAQATLKSIATGLATAVAQFTVATTSPPTTAPPVAGP